MFAFLDAWYKRVPSDELGSLLSYMSLLADGGTADPAVWSDWLEAVRKAISGEVDLQLKLKRSK